MSLSVINAFKQNIPFPLSPMFNAAPLPVENLSWIAVSFLSDKFNITSLIQNNKLPYISYSGFRKPHITQLKKEFFMNMSIEFSYFTGDQIGALNEEQIQSISPATFAYINTISLKSLNPKYIKILSYQQLNKLSSTHYREMTCIQIKEITEKQKIQLEESSKVSIQNRLDDCYQQMDPTYDETTSGHDSQKKELSTALVIIYVMLGILLLVIITLIIIYFVTKEKDYDYV